VNDEIDLVLPAQEDFRHIAHLVMGGLAARLDLTYEQLEDLQVALEAVLGCRDDAGEISVRLAVGHGAVRTTVGPFAAQALDELDADEPTLGLRRVLETVADSVEVSEHDGASYVELTKETAP
jgi:hypothetical protein